MLLRIYAINIRKDNLPGSDGYKAAIIMNLNFEEQGLTWSILRDAFSVYTGSPAATHSIYMQK